MPLGMSAPLLWLPQVVLLVYRHEVVLSFLEDAS